MSEMNKPSAPLVLEIGCGPRKRPGAIGLDLNPSSAADVICDLNRFPYPFADNLFDEIICEHILEHLDDLVKVMEELYRVAKPGALIRVAAPYFSSVYFYRDPTHKLFFSAHTFDYFIPGTAVHSFHYSEATFARRRVTFPATPHAGPFRRAFFRWINDHIDFYEHNLAYILPRHLICYELEVLKD